ncbi:hypothetical protein [uncultured Enterococcus sp.]|uniref:hypothetical protein n=1 Tax=uncultured Enterococcus sp. TaxID=167972 RepID=UPI002AA75939|nr:hypothetical protein [uncultured Enterococcus sp.]
MTYRDYSKPYRDLGEAFIDIVLKHEKGTDEEISKISMWYYDFVSIITKIPLNSEGMYDGLAYHYHVDEPWKECEDELWAVDEVELSLLQLMKSKENLKSDTGQTEEDQTTLIRICNDMIGLFKESNEGDGKVYIKYYY